MSVERRNGRWVARWRDAGGRGRSRAFDLKRHADDFDTRVRRAKQTGLGGHDATETLAELGAEHFNARHADLAPTTRAVYAGLWNAHVAPNIGGVPLRDLTPEVLEAWRADLEAAAVGPQSVRKTLVLVQTVLERAVARGRMLQNPAKLASKPAAAATRAPVHITPARVERIRAAMRPRDATLVSVLAYAGLRPGEALGLAWRHVGRTLRVERAVAAGVLGPTKTRAKRNVPLLAPLAHDLADWRAGAPPDALVFPAADGGPWSPAAWRNWRRRVFAPAATAAGLPPSARPYDLRHAYVSLRVHEGATVVEGRRSGPRAHDGT